MYTIFDAPLQMLADSPTNYQAEQESTDFIATVPTVFDETVPLDGKVGEYVAVAKRKGDAWYVGAMTNWTPRDLTIDLSFLGSGAYHAVVFQDGVNARKDARDYKRLTRRVTASEKLSVHLAEGGGWAARIEPVR
jgi:alpha-glucosidase